MRHHPCLSLRSLPAFDLVQQLLDRVLALQRLELVLQRLGRQNLTGSCVFCGLYVEYGRLFSIFLFLGLS